MPDRHSIKPKAVRMPGGLESRVKAALIGDESVNGFIVAAIEEKVARREGGSTTPAAPVRLRRGSTTRKPEASTAPAATSREPESASDIMAALRRRRNGD